MVFAAQHAMKLRRNAMLAFVALILPTSFAVPAEAQQADLSVGEVASRTADSESTAPRYGVETDWAVPVEMSDGVDLLVDVYYPTDPATGERATGPFPVLLMQNPYESGQLLYRSGASTPAFFVERGYIFAHARVRGTGGSGGTYCFLCEREQQDGADLVEWAAQLGGSTGSVGLNGCSYLGANQFFTAAKVGRDSALKVMAPGGNGTSVYRSSLFFGGVPTETPGVLFGGALQPAMGAKGLTVLAGIQSGGPEAYDGEFWQKRTAANVAEEIVNNRVPALLRGEWTDVHTSTMLEMYAMLQNASFNRDVWQQMRPHQPTTPRYQMIMYPGGHCEGYAESEDVLSWYNTWLKGADTGMLKTRETLRLSVLGTDSWLEGSSYPIVQDYTPLYLHPEGRLDREKPNSSGGGDQLVFGSPVESTYETPPFEKAVTLAGPMALTVYASSTATNLLLVADVFDVAPDGSTELVTTGGLIGSMSELDPDRTWEDPDGELIRPYHRFLHDGYLAPGEVQRFDVELRNRVVQLERGHRLRLVVKGSLARGEITPGGLPRGLGPGALVPTTTQAQTLAGAIYSIEHGMHWPSHLTVPFLPDRNEGSSGRSNSAPGSPDNATTIAVSPPAPPSATDSATSVSHATAEELLPTKALPATGGGGAAAAPLALLATAGALALRRRGRSAPNTH